MVPVISTSLEMTDCGVVLLSIRFPPGFLLILTGTRRPPPKLAGARVAETAGRDKTKHGLRQELQRRGGRGQEDRRRSNCWNAEVPRKSAKSGSTLARTRSLGSRCKAFFNSSMASPERCCTAR